ncbi:hypothetical protein BV25DRAFT_1828938 [Artomyces pyxidatus]|uniref:Uncharacterized protein n=1 Tax=Artomyces pyxidatus TaxID=48021 RepID=A0ACB8SSJ4_9AGAM|nr:hypothetical protein BV25DRAFT_1828938 [Artomyces pyxidatus]
MNLRSRHLSDVSDVSLTFQLPYDATRLLDEDSHDFLRGFDDSLSTPAPRKADPPLTIDELTPGRKLASELQDALSSTLAHESSPLRRSPRKHRRLDQEKRRTETSKRRKFEDLTEDLTGLQHSSTRTTDVSSGSGDAFPASPKRPAQSSPKRPVTAKNLLNIVPARLHPEKIPIMKAEVQPLPLKPAPAESSLSQKASSRLATDRLLGYGDRLQSAPTNVESRPSARQGTRCAIPDTVSSLVAPRDHPPLTLSQLSPQRSEAAAECPTAWVRPVSPMRPSKKRSVSPTIDSGATRAQREMGLATAVERTKRVKTIQPSTAQKPTDASSKPPPQAHTAKPALLHARRPASIIRRNEGVPTSSRKVGTSRIQDKRRAAKLDDPQFSNNGRRVAGRKPAPGHGSATGAAPSAKPTKPIGFRFELDARLEARRLEFQEKVNAAFRRPEPHQPLPVPDFQALHAAEADLAAARKQHVVPFVPAPPLELATEARIKEREKFDAARRAREREIELQKEERLRLQAAAEEREIRELRRLAVPKAHEVPEWYATAPKRKR